MDLGELEVLMCLAEERSFSRAAEKLGRSQPAISQALKRLEDELGVPLFDRSSRRGHLTEAGRILESYARRMLDLRSEAAHAIGALQGLHRGELRLVANESISMYLLPPLLRAYRRRHPAVKVELARSASEQIPSELLDGELDFGFLSFDPIHRELEAQVLLQDELVLVVPPGHPLAQKGSVAIPDLGRETFVAHLARTPSRTRLVELFASEDTPLNIVLELASIETIKEFVALGEGLAILPGMSVRAELASGRLKAVAVKGMRITRQVRMIRRRHRPLSQAAKAFQELVAEMGLGKEG